MEAKKILEGFGREREGTLGNEFEVWKSVFPVNIVAAMVLKFFKFVFCLMTLLCCVCSLSNEMKLDWFIDGMIRYS